MCDNKKNQNLNTTMEVDASSDSSTTSKFEEPRLGSCEVCNNTEAKYTCPKCEVKTCCLKCLNIHKKELKCDGIRDRTKYIPIKKMTNLDYLSDYNFLEECTRFVEDRKRDKIKRFTRYNKNLPGPLFKLRCAANERKTTLRFLLQNFTKHNSNTSYYNGKEKTIFWRVEWIFTNAGNLKYVDECCSENVKLSELLAKYLEANESMDTTLKKNLEYYQSRGLAGVKVLLKAEGVKKCKNRFFQLDCKISLKENLAKRTLVEFPTIYIIFDDIIKEFDVIDTDDDIEAETKTYIDSVYKREVLVNHKTEEEVSKHMENLVIEKKRAERKKKRDERQKEPHNLLFMDENLWDELSSDTDDGNVTEEEEMCSPKRIKKENV